MRFQGGRATDVPVGHAFRVGRPRRALAARGRRFGRSAVVDEVRGDVAGGQFELAGFVDRQLLAYETVCTGRRNGRDHSQVISLSTQIKLIIYQLI